MLFRRRFFSVGGDGQVASAAAEYRLANTTDTRLSVLLRHTGKRAVAAIRQIERKQLRQQEKSRDELKCLST
jgi:hypothetical protein